MVVVDREVQGVKWGTWVKCCKDGLIGVEVRSEEVWNGGRSSFLVGITLSFDFAFDFEGSSFEF